MIFSELFVVILPFATAIIITTVALHHKRRVLEMQSGTDIDIIDLNKKIDTLTEKVDYLQKELQKEKKI
ncbi:hypothetical protein QA612_15425 [Evansella sp. AB-P1]|uniref:hypothetical protein n=1 Tax=Evansella sp. AB-P1 TaxID=3037653 RepID=UPI00241F7333|nr:hypothetical protein [Evansella sp. AB-P1]MDG5788862.1 hypothetical protein [Evansella sp. AB-P1]